MSEPAVIVEERGGCWIVRLNAPHRRNALSRAVVSGLLEVADRVATRPAVRAVVLCSSGDQAFCAGADLKERKAMNEPEVREFLALLARTFLTIERSPRIWIAAIQGACLGGGLELALCTDLRIARADAVVGLTETRLGIIPGAGGTQRLSRLIGIGRAKALILTAARVDAQTALSHGIVGQVADDHMAAALSVADEVCRCAPVALTQAKRAIDQGWDLHLEAGLAWEKACYEVTIRTEDRLEGLRAFAEKREPRFHGR